MNKDSLVVITEDEGLSSNLINEVYPQNDSILWVCTNAGLNRVIFGANDYTITNIDELNKFDVSDI